MGSIARIELVYQATVRFDSRVAGKHRQVDPIESAGSIPKGGLVALRRFNLRVGASMAKVKLIPKLWYGLN